GSEEARHAHAADVRDHVDLRRDHDDRRSGARDDYGRGMISGRALLLVVLLGASITRGESIIYVSGGRGDDQWSGASAEPLGDHGPVATLERALNRAAGME